MIVDGRVLIPLTRYQYYEYFYRVDYISLLVHLYSIKSHDICVGVYHNFSMTLISSYENPRGVIALKAVSLGMPMRVYILPLPALITMIAKASFA